MFLNITGLTEKGKDIKSSNMVKVGKVHRILKNTIVMEIKGEGGEVFFLPNSLIDKIYDKTVYLNLDSLDFKEWWQIEGADLATDYTAELKTYFTIDEIDIERIEHKIKIALEENFSDKQITSAIEHHTCPYCRSPIDTSDQPKSAECGLLYIRNKDGYTFSERSRTTLYNLQWGLRLSLPYTVNEMLNPDEWVYHRNFLAEPGYLVRTKGSKSPIRKIRIVTSQRLINFEMGGGQDHNWEIPIEKITGTCLVIYGSGHGYTGIQIKYEALDKTKRKIISISSRDVKDHLGELYFLDKYLHILNDRIVDYAPGLITGPAGICGGGWFEGLIKERLTRPCPHCGKDIEKTMLICPNCDDDAFFVHKNLQKAIIEEPPSELFICPYCNSRMKLGGKFCAECGAEIDQTFSIFLPLMLRMELGDAEIIKPIPISERKFHRRCGSYYPIGAKFCIKCGRPVQ